MTFTNKIIQRDNWPSSIASALIVSFGKEMLEDEQNLVYKYLDEVSVPLLGGVDDLIGVAEDGYKTNTFVNVKTADKDLKFGIDKCKVMIVSKRKPHKDHRTIFRFMKN